MTPDEAETIALKGLGFLVGSSADLERFVAGSGVEPDAFRLRAQDPHFLAAVIDFLLTGDELLLAFCTAESLDPKRVHLARHALSRA